MSNYKIKEFEEFFKESIKRLEKIKEKEYDQWDENSKSEYDGLKEMFEMLSKIKLDDLKK